MICQIEGPEGRRSPQVLHSLQSCVLSPCTRTFRTDLKGLNCAFNTSRPCSAGAFGMHSPSAVLVLSFCRNMPQGQLPLQLPFCSPCHTVTYRSPQSSTSGNHWRMLTACMQHPVHLSRAGGAAEQTALLQVGLRDPPGNVRTWYEISRGGGHLNGFKVVLCTMRRDVPA